MENDAQEYCLKWNNHHNTLVSVMDSLLKREALVDVVLAAEGRFLKVHRLVLFACSQYFQELLEYQLDKHAVVFLKDVAYKDLQALVDYMYKGEVNISQDQVESFLQTAEALKIKGLADKDKQAEYAANLIIKASPPLTKPETNSTSEPHEEIEKKSEPYSITSSPKLEEYIDTNETYDQYECVNEWSLKENEENSAPDGLENPSKSSAPDGLENPSTSHNNQEDWCSGNITGQSISHTEFVASSSDSDGWQLYPNGIHQDSSNSNMNYFEGINSNEKRKKRKLKTATMGDTLNQPDWLKNNLEYFGWPMSSADEFICINDRLMEKKEESKAISELMSIGGNSTGNVARNILRALFSKENARNFSWHGRKGNIRIKDTVLGNIILFVIKSSSVNSKSNPEKLELCIVKHITNWFRHAKDYKPVEF